MIKVKSLAELMDKHPTIYTYSYHNIDAETLEAMLNELESLEYMNPVVSLYGDSWMVQYNEGKEMSEASIKVKPLLEVLDKHPSLSKFMYVYISAETLQEILNELESLEYMSPVISMFGDVWLVQYNEPVVVPTKH